MDNETPIPLIGYPTIKLNKEDLICLMASCIYERFGNTGGIEHIWASKAIDQAEVIYDQLKN